MEAEGEKTGLTKRTDHLKCRIESHARFARFEINDWIFSMVQPRIEERVLDLGCGTGKQCIPLARMVGRGGWVVALDVSEDALSLIGDNHLKNIKTVNASMDQCLEILGDQGFDLIVSCFAIYYASDPVELIQGLHRILMSTGRMFLCGNDQGNNQELIDLLNVATPDGQQYQPMKPFMSDEQLEMAFASYAGYETTTFENPLVFPNVKSVLKYWESYSLYRPELRTPLEQVLTGHFKEHSTFTTIKRVRGILAHA